MQPVQPGDHPNRPSRSLRARRTYPALPAATSPTTPIAPRVQGRNALQPYTGGNGGQAPVSPVQDARKLRSSPARQAVWRLPALGVLLALLYLAFYPLYAGATSGRDGAKAALLSFFPWLAHLDWTAWTPITRAISHVAPFNLPQPAGFANLLIAGFALAFVPFLLSARAARAVTRERVLAREARLLFWIILAFAAIFGLLFVFAPTLGTQDALLYGLYGRAVAVYHSNPYTASAASLALPSGDILRGVVVGSVSHPTFGPVWMDVALAIALFARSSAAILLDYRLLALVAHLLSTVVVWNLLAQLRREVRFSGTLLFGWNPVFLLLGVGEMHLEMMVVCLVLLAALFYQRRSHLLCWICLLLSALINPLALLLVPLFLSLLWKASRSMITGRRTLWWLALIGISAFMVTLAYLPYWPGWSIRGIGEQLGNAFAPGSASQSLATAIQHLPISTSPVFGWLATPLFWNILAITVAACLLLFGLWLTENLAFALLFASWLAFVFLVFSPLYEPWFVLLPLALALAGATTRTTLLALLLGAGALLTYILSLWSTPWTGLGLVTIGLPCLIWGWSLFLSSTWHMTRAGNANDSAQMQAVKQPGGAPRFSRPPWSSRPSRSSRPAWPGRK